MAIIMDEVRAVGMSKSCEILKKAKQYYETGVFLIVLAFLNVRKEHNGK